MPKYGIATWKNYDIGDVRNVSTPDLIKAVERSGKAANLYIIKNATQTRKVVIR